MADFFERGLTEIDWTEIDQGMGPLLASPADVGGRGIRVFIGPGGTGADLAGATVWLLWRHRQTHAAGVEPFEGAAGQVGVFCVRYPAAMAASEGEAECQIVVRGADGRRLASRAFAVRVGSDVAGSLSPCEGGRFLDVIERCGSAAEAARGSAEELRAAAAAGEFDGADGVSPTARVERTEGGARITVTDASGTTTAEVSDGAKGDPGAPGADADVVAATATVDGTSGTPAVEVALGGEPGARELAFSFSGLKGEAVQSVPGGLKFCYADIYIDKNISTATVEAERFFEGDMLLSRNGFVGTVGKDIKLNGYWKTVQISRDATVRGSCVAYSVDEAVDAEPGEEVEGCRFYGLCPNRRDYVFNLKTGCVLEVSEISLSSVSSAEGTLVGVGRLATKGMLDQAVAGLATKEYVDGLFGQLADLSGEEF